LISIEKKKNVILSNGVKVSCDDIIAKENLNKYNAIYLPGGPGHKFFNEQYAPKLAAHIKKNYKNKDLTFMAMCAASTVFADYGILDMSVKLTCYPGLEKGKLEKNYVKKDVVFSKNFITGAGPGVAKEFALEVAAHFTSPQKAKDVAKEMLYK
jgi:putative intracellular protease/amidase